MSLAIVRREDEEPDVEEIVIKDMLKVEQAYESPFRTYARYLARYDTINPYHAEILRMRYPVSLLWKAEINYRRHCNKNFLGQITGGQGSGKSLSAMRLAMDYDPDWVTHNKGNYDLPKIFWSYEDLIDYVRTDAKKGDMLVLDEEPRYFGMGSMALDQAIDNLESTLRFEEINFIFVYVTQRSHKIHTLFYTRGEHFSKPPYVDYFVLGVLQPLVEQTHYVLLGLMPVDVPDQKIIEAYLKRKAEFTKGMKESGGFGAPKNILDEYGWLLKLLADDEKFLSLSPSAQVDYIHYTYRIPKGLASLLIRMLGV